jgi:hypothetical protein
VVAVTVSAPVAMGSVEWFEPHPIVAVIRTDALQAISRRTVIADR